MKLTIGFVCVRVSRFMCLRLGVCICRQKKNMMKDSCYFMGVLTSILLVS